MPKMTVTIVSPNGRLHLSPHCPRRGIWSGQLIHQLVIDPTDPSIRSRYVLCRKCGAEKLLPLTKEEYWQTVNQLRIEA